ncbi:MAG: amidohydrolase [Pseudomonadota bacterium]
MSWKASFTAVSLLALGASACADDHTSDLHASVVRHYDEHLADLFRHFHANPELSFKEVNTAARLAEELRTLGYGVTENFGGTGVVAVLENGTGPTVMIRADMDGLPVPEQSGLDYASTATQKDIDGIVKPVMHACGHDMHMTTLVGAGKQLMDLKDDWSGTLILIGQPAEERVGGARAMLADGLYTKFPKPDYALGFHVWSGFLGGLIHVPEENAFSSADSVDITVYGVGGHGALPHLTVDPVVIASQIVVSLQTVVSRSIAPKKPGVITVGSIHGGTKHNIIGEEVHLQLTVRANDPETRTALLDGIDRIAQGTAAAFGIPEEKMPKVVRSPTETTPPTNNDPATARLVEAAIVDAMGNEALVRNARLDGMPGEDFAYFVTPESGVKGVNFRVGGAFQDDIDSPTSHHAPGFRIDPQASVINGTEAMVVSAIALFDEGAD